MSDLYNEDRMTRYIEAGKRVSSMIRMNTEDLTSEEKLAYYQSPEFRKEVRKAFHPPKDVEYDAQISAPPTAEEKLSQWMPDWAAKTTAGFGETTLGAGYAFINSVETLFNEEKREAALNIGAVNKIRKERFKEYLVQNDPELASVFSPDAFETASGKAVMSGTAKVMDILGEISKDAAHTREVIDKYMLHKKNFNSSEIGQKLAELEQENRRVIYDSEEVRGFIKGATDAFASDQEAMRLSGAREEDLEQTSADFGGRVVGEALKMYAANKIVPGNVMTKGKILPKVVNNTLYGAGNMGIYSLLDTENSGKDIANDMIIGGAFSGALTIAPPMLKGMAREISENQYMAHFKDAADNMVMLSKPTVDKAVTTLYNTTIKAPLKGAYKGVSYVGKKADDIVLRGTIQELRRTHAEAINKNIKSIYAEMDKIRAEAIKPLINKKTGTYKKHLLTKSGKLKPAYADRNGLLDIEKAMKATFGGEKLFTSKGKIVAARARRVAESEVASKQLEMLHMHALNENRKLQNWINLPTSIHSLLLKADAQHTFDDVLNLAIKQNTQQRRFSEFVKRAGKAKLLNKNGYIKDMKFNQKVADVIEGRLPMSKLTKSEKHVLEPLLEGLYDNRVAYAKMVGKNVDDVGANYWARLTRLKLEDTIIAAKRLGLADDTERLQKYVNSEMGAPIDKAIVQALARGKGRATKEGVKELLTKSPGGRSYFKKRTLTDEQWANARDLDVIRIAEHMLIKETSGIHANSLAKAMRQTQSTLDKAGISLSTPQKLWLSMAANKYDPQYQALGGLRKTWCEFIGISKLPEDTKRTLLEIKDPVSYIFDKTMAINAFAGLGLKPSYMAKNATQPLQGTLIGRPIKHTIGSQFEAASILKEGIVPKNLRKQLGADAQTAIEIKNMLRGDTIRVGSGIDIKAGGRVAAILKRGSFANIELSDTGNVYANILANLKWGRSMGMSGNRLKDFAMVETALEQHMYAFSTRSVLSSHILTKPFTMFTSWGYDTLDFALHGRQMLAQRYPEYAKHIAGKHPLLEAVKWVGLQYAAVGGLEVATGYNLESAKPHAMVKATLLDTPYSWADRTASMWPMGGIEETWESVKRRFLF